MIQLRFPLLLTVAICTACVIVGWLFWRDWFRYPGLDIVCQYGGYRYKMQTKDDALACLQRTANRFSAVECDATDEGVRDSCYAYLKCTEASAKLFLDRDYAETKDLCKAFLTLLTAVFVASVTFSEKIVNLSTARSWERGSMILCWILLLISISACGAGLALMAYAAGYAAYFPQVDYRSYETRAIYLFITAGLAFGTSLAALLLAGILSLKRRVQVPT